MRIRIMVFLTACTFTISACSLITMQPPPQDYRPYQPPKCAGDAPPALDTVAAIASLAGAVVFFVLADTSDFCEMREPCTTITPGSAFGLGVGFSALSLAFGLSAASGYGWSDECGVAERDHRKWGEAMYPSLQVARVDALRRAKARQCRELQANWRKKIATASLQLKECKRFMAEYRRERTMLAETRLHLAVESGEIDKLKKLLTSHPNVNIKDRRGWTALHWAAQRGDREIIEVLLEAGLNPDGGDKHGATPMHLAAFAGHAAVIKRLATVADVNARTKSGATPLHAAVLGAHARAVQALLDLGAEPEAEDAFGRTPAFYSRIVQEPELEKLLTGKDRG